MSTSIILFSNTNHTNHHELFVLFVQFVFVYIVNYILVNPHESFVPFTFVLSRPLVGFGFASRSEATTKARRRHDEGRVEASVCRPSIILYPKSPKLGCHFLRKKRWHMVAHDDNNNNNKCETTIHTHYTNCKANIKQKLACPVSDRECLMRC